MADSFSFQALYDPAPESHPMELPWSHPDADPMADLKFMADLYGARTEDERRWVKWLRTHPECRDHEQGVHDGPVNPDGCGHCQNCHYGDESCHWIGCPGC